MADFNPQDSYVSKVVDSELDPNSAYDLTMRNSEGETNVEGVSAEDIVNMLEKAEIWAPVTSYDSETQEIEGNYEPLETQVMWYDGESYNIGTSGQIKIKPSATERRPEPAPVMSDD